jgi:hypothetical protein
LGGKAGQTDRRENGGHEKTEFGIVHSG